MICERCELEFSPMFQGDRLCGNCCDILMIEDELRREFYDPSMDDLTRDID